MKLTKKPPVLQEVLHYSAIFYATRPILLNKEVCDAMAERILGNSMYLILKSLQVSLMILLMAG